MSQEPVPVDSPESPMAAAGFRKRNLVIIGAVVVALWALAIYSQSLAFLIVMGVLTLALAGVVFWVLRLLKKQQGLTNLLQGATMSPEARRAAIAKLQSGKDANEAVNIIARAQLEAAEDPRKAMEILEAIERKRIPAQVQDDFALLLSQLYLNFGRPKDARPLVDMINLDNPARKAQRGLMAVVVAEAWARTGKHAEAIEVLGTVDLASAENKDVRLPLLAARVFARFAAGKKGLVREDLRAIAEENVNQLGRFVMPQFRVHPELQRMARQIAQGAPQARSMAVAHPGMGRRVR